MDVVVVVVVGAVVVGGAFVTDALLQPVAIMKAKRRMSCVRGAHGSSSIWHRACECLRTEELDATLHPGFGRREVDHEVHERNDDDVCHSPSEGAMKILVTCHARAPMTRTVADEVATVLHADVDLIIPRQTGEGLVGWLRGAYEATFD